ncbi:acyl-CoA-binding protein [Tenacibaculum geojense]|uniref:Acyl-CoA-binding protein n=1 Tax=Tenacibaculum geojense TaxID=915352 RepID=A0ABW3JPR6_9FLAO
MTTDLDTKFKEAFNKVSKINKDLPPDVLLRLYAYYKQATKGDRFSVNDAEDDIKSAFKFNAWIQLRGMDENQAKEEYIELVNSIIK